MLVKLFVGNEKSTISASSKTNRNLIKKRIIEQERNLDKKSKIKRAYSKFYTVNMDDKPLTSKEPNFDFLHFTA